MKETLFCCFVFAADVTRLLTRYLAYYLHRPFFVFFQMLFNVFVRCLTSCGTSIDACNRIQKEIVKPEKKTKAKMNTPYGRANERINDYNNSNKQPACECIRDYIEFWESFFLLSHKRRLVIFICIMFCFFDFLQRQISSIWFTFIWCELNTTNSHEYFGKIATTTTNIVINSLICCLTLNIETPMNLDVGVSHAWSNRSINDRLIAIIH